MIQRSSKKSGINLNKKKLFPSISRTITEAVFSYIKAEKYLLIASFFGVFFFCLMLSATIQLSASLKKQKQVMAQKEKVAHDLAFWQQVTKERPDYRDGYFMLAVLEYRVGKKQQATQHVAKALEIDPNFKEGRELKELLFK